MGFSEYMDQCLSDLEDANEYKTDQLLVQLIKIQRLTEKILRFHNGNLPVAEILPSLGPPTMTTIEALRVELDSLRKAIPQNLQSDCMISKTLIPSKMVS